MSSEFIKLLRTYVVNFIISFAIFSILFLALAEYNPFISLSRNAKEEYIYTYNMNYDEVYSEEELEDASYYNYTYEGDDVVMVMNRRALREGVPTLFLSNLILVFPISYNFDIQENVKYPLSDFKVYSKGFVETSIGTVAVDVSYILVDDSISRQGDYSFCIYPPSDSEKIVITDSAGGGYVVNRGNDIQHSVLWAQSVNGQVMAVISIVPIVLLLLASFFFFNFEMMKDKYFIYVSYLFYMKRWKIKLDSFTKLFVPTIAAYISSCLLAYVSFLRVQFSLLSIIIIVTSIIIFVYSVIVTNKIINSIIGKKGA